MIPNNKDRSITSTGVMESGQFGISRENEAHIMGILRDTLYSDKILAVLREYAANAWDANREVGKADVPIKIALPTDLEPTLSIRDYGPGLSREGVFQVYTQYGASTKRNNDNSVGMLGIGSKSAFAYSDSFTITSFHGGKKCIYIAALDASDKGIISLQHEEDCGDETGVLIQIAVSPSNIREFEYKAQALFQHFVPRPEINIELPAAPKTRAKLQHGIIYETGDADLRYRRDNWTAVMGCVPYRINLEHLKGEDPSMCVPEYVHKISGVLHFNIGEVQINASREELKYSDMTKKALASKFNQLVDEYVKTILDDIHKMQATVWEKRLRAQVLHSLRALLPEASQWMGSSQVFFKQDTHPESFVIRQGTKEDDIKWSLTVHTSTRLVLRDDMRAWKGFNFQYYDYIIFPESGFSLNDVEKDLATFCDDLQITGIKIIRTSQLPWTQPARLEGRQPNTKHRKRLFKFDPNSAGNRRVPSTRWQAIDHEPSQDDVYILINNFKTPGWDFYHAYYQDTDLADHFKKKMPMVIGYKSTDTKPVDATKIPGKEYRVWRDEFVKSLLTPDNVSIIQDMEWLERLKVYVGYGEKPEKVDRKNQENLLKWLGADHPFYKMFWRHWSVKSKLKKENLNHGIRVLINRAEALGVLTEYDIDKEIKPITDRYPLFAAGTDLKVLVGNDAEAWCHYVRSIDQLLELTKKGNDTP